MKLFKSSERGQALIVIALSALVLFGFVGLAVDGSLKFSDRRRAQNAADTAALAAALQKVTMLTKAETDSSITTTPTTCASTPSSAMVGASSVCSALVLSALDRAASNGYDNITNNTVAIYSPPVSGYYTGNDDYVQVIITSHVKTTFMRILGITQSDNIVQAVAYLSKGRTLGDGAMIISYDPHPNCSSGTGTNNGSVNVSGNGTVNLTGGGIFVNSQETCGFAIPNCANLTISGGAGVNSAATIDNINQVGCANQVPENINQDPVSIPDDVQYPSVPSSCSYAPPNPTPLGSVINAKNGQSVGEWLIYPGYYETFPPSNLVGNNQYIYMKSGVYCIDPDGPTKDSVLSWSPNAYAVLNGSKDPLENKYWSYSADGVTLYIKTGAGFTLNASSPTYLDAPTTGDYAGYLIVLEGNKSSIQSCSISGGADIDLNGMIFAPYCNITVNGGSSTSAKINAQLLGWDLLINGNNTINFNYDPAYKIRLKRTVGLMK